MVFNASVLVVFKELNWHFFLWCDCVGEIWGQCQLTMGTCDIVHWLVMVPLPQVDTPLNSWVLSSCLSYIKLLKTMNLLSCWLLNIFLYQDSHILKFVFIPIVMFASVLLLMFLPLFEIKDLSEVYMFAFSFQF